MANDNPTESSDQDDEAQDQSAAFHRQTQALKQAARQRAKQAAKQQVTKQIKKRVAMIVLEALGAFFAATWWLWLIVIPALILVIYIAIYVCDIPGVSLGLQLISISPIPGLEALNGICEAFGG